MAHVKDNIFITGVSGTVGKKMNFRVRKGKTVIAVKRGPSTVPPTEEQQEIREQFIIASLYAQNAMKDPVVKALYQKAAKGGQTAYNAAFSDAAKPPVIYSIVVSAYKGAIGDLITILARDVVPPKSVTVVILSQAGTVLEEGAAILGITTDKREWAYKTTVANATLTGTRIVVTATDLPGNVTEEEVVIS